MASSQRKPVPAKATPQRILAAALKTLQREGYAGTSARSIARTGKFNQALIFYHYGSVSDLLLAVVDKISAERMARYRSALDGAGSLAEFADAAATLFQEDMRSGHATVLAEMVAASLAAPDLGPQIVKRMEPWLRYTEEVITRLLRASPFEALAKPTEIAQAVIAFYMGLELLTHLDGDRTRVERLFAMGRNLAKDLEPLVALQPAASQKLQGESR